MSLLFALLFFKILQLTTRHSQTSALIVFVTFLAFFYYGHVQNLLHTYKMIIRDDILAIVWLLTIVLVSVLIYRNGRHWKTEIVAVTLNLMTITLLIFPITLLLTYVISAHPLLKRKTDHTVQVDANPTSPDIYYIVLDAYTRSDVMKNKFGYDNSLFINSLQDMGFYVAECSQSNYSMTSLSLASTLNMDYLQNLSDAYKPKREQFVVRI